MTMIKKMLGLLGSRERMQAFGLLTLFLLMSLCEVVGIASILPFMSVLADPDSVTRNEWLKRGYEYFEFSSPKEYLFFIGVGVLVILVFTNIVKAVTRWVTLYVTQSWGEGLSRRLFDIYLRQPYRFFLDRNSSDISKNVLAEVQTLSNAVLMAFLDMVTRIIVSAVILLFLAIMDPVLALATCVILGGAYLLVFLGFKSSLKKEAQRRNQAQAEKYRIVNEAIQGIKNIKLGGYESLYRDYFREPAQNFAGSNARSSVIGEMPRYAMEIIAFGGVLLMTLYLLQSQQGLNQALPMIALYTLAGYRLMPGLQGIYQGYTRIRFYSPALDTVERELALAATMQETSTSDIQALNFQRALSLRNVGFQYNNTGREILKDVNLEIPAGSMTGIIGKTGAGKTTLVDIILGLLEPASGQLLVDGVAVSESNRKAWQKNLSYVSQHIYLCDDTITANIAFGMRPEEIDMEKVREATKMASLSDFIENELAQGYDTIVGENGIRLSGGQRQRVGIARALYLGRPVLVLDEATSALDPATEREVMDAVHAAGLKKTIFIISHKPELLTQCDSVLVVQGGNVEQKKADPEDLRSELLAHKRFD
ncbi:MAG: ABC transporter ATP-binding protein [Alphaproteobacteria bacterium]|jgi:ABC-type bacteriocin/lantibiotic exporter with double-glycine peptidase domain|nr:ABC transporter ATP-binding protein [Alphaproteobacteria bacterium]